MDYGAGCMYATQGQRGAHAKPLCIVENQPLKYMWQNKTWVTFFLSFRTYRCNKALF